MKKDEVSKEEEKRREEEEELERKRKELEEKKKKEEEKIDSLRPKQYTQEELEAYYKLMDEVNNDFATMIMR